MRAFLGGRGFPREEFALSGEAAEVNPETPIVLILENGEVLHPADYISLGFTQFDAWVVGAAGGVGGGSSTGATFQVTETTEVMSAGQWDLFVEGRYLQTKLSEYYASRPPVTTPPYYVPATYDSVRAELEARNPSHSFKIRTYHDPVLANTQTVTNWPEGTYSVVPGGVGGVPGGGGLQIVSGELADLPADVAATVGQVGAHGASGQVKQNGLWYPDPVLIYWTYGYRGNNHPDVSGWNLPAWLDPLGSNARRQEIVDALIPWLVRNPSPVGFPNPQGAQDGGYSAFGDVAKASGGKGGRASHTWDGTKFVVDAKGGDGGAGNSIVAGGGGAAAVLEYSPGKDGLWDPATRIGQGGGAARGPILQAGVYGGRGSWSYADTSLYGAATGPAGGGAKILRKYLHGSMNSKYNPNGAVILRLYRVG